MNTVTVVHVAAGIVALAAGTIAAVARKGPGAHAAAGIGFSVAMLVLGLTAAFLLPLKSPPESPVGGLMVCYFVATAWMTARRRSGVPGWFERSACAAVLVMAFAIIGHGFEVLFALPGQFKGPPGPVALFGLGGICLLAGLLDLRFIVRGTLSATQRLSRHLWRMCFAFFIATGSFFLGQQDVLPSVLHGSPLLFVMAFAPFALMLFWLVRVRIGRSKPVLRPAAFATEESP